jgi:hypothetical protein
MPTIRRTVLLPRLAACALLVGVAASPAMAQLSIPDAVLTSPRLSDDDAKVLQAYIDKYKANLDKDADRNAVKVARNYLVEPLANPGVSVDFRIRYSGQLITVLDPLLKSTSDFVASNALQILGELATPGAVEKIVPMLADKRPTVRFSAAYACERVFENLMPNRSPGLTSTQATGLVDAVTARIAAEDDANVAQELVSALEAAAAIPAAALKDVRSAAVASAARSVAARAKGMDGKESLAAGWRGVLWRANRLTRTALTQAPASATEPKLSDEATKQAGALAGHTLALVLRRMQAGIASPDERDMLAKIAALAEATYYFTHSARGGTPNPQGYKLDKLVGDLDAAKYEAGAMEIIGPNGALTSPAFGFPDDEFVPKKR